MYRYNIMVRFNNGQFMVFGGTFKNDWDAQDSTHSRYPDACLIVPTRIGRVQ